MRALTKSTLGHLVLPLGLLFALCGPADAVDGVIEINQPRALAGGITPGDEPGFPVVIDRGGSYVLTGNLDASGATSIVQIDAAHVTLDLNGFRMVNAQSGIFSSFDAVTIRNGTVSDVTSNNGVNLQGRYARVERLNVIAVGGIGVGILIGGDGCHVSDSTVSEVANGGISGDDGCTITNNVVSIVTGDGISCIDSCTIDGNVVRSSSGNGILVSSGGVVTGNTVEHLLVGTGIRTEGPSTVSGNTVETCQIGIAVTSSTVTGNTVANNTGVGLNTGLSNPSAVGQNVFWSNNGGNANAQISGPFVQIGTNQCGTDTTCP